MHKITELDGVIKKSPRLKEKSIISRVLLFALGQSNDLRHVGEDAVSLIEHTPVYGCHGRDILLLLLEVDLHWRKDVGGARDTADKPCCGRERVSVRGYSKLQQIFNLRYHTSSLFFKIFSP